MCSSITERLLLSLLTLLMLLHWDLLEKTPAEQAITHTGFIMATVKEVNELSLSLPIL